MKIKLVPIIGIALAMTAYSCVNEKDALTKSGLQKSNNLHLSTGFNKELPPPINSDNAVKTFEKPKILGITEDSLMELKMVRDLATGKIPVQIEFASDIKEESVQNRILVKVSDRDFVCDNEVKVIKNKISCLLTLPTVEEIDLKPGITKIQFTIKEGLAGIKEGDILKKDLIIIATVTDDQVNPKDATIYQLVPTSESPLMEGNRLSFENAKSITLEFKRIDGKTLDPKFDIGLEKLVVNRFKIEVFTDKTYAVSTEERFAPKSISIIGTNKIKLDLTDAQGSALDVGFYQIGLTPEKGNKPKKANLKMDNFRFEIFDPNHTAQTSPATQK